MADRLQLPDDRPIACWFCGKYRPEYSAQCADCDTNICSDCSVMTLPGKWPDVELCKRCAMKRLNQEIEALVPVCVCEWPTWIRYGQQLSFPGRVA